jgi:hypothetical protein
MLASRDLLGIVIGLPITHGRAGASPPCTRRGEPLRA